MKILKQMLYYLLFLIIIMSWIVIPFSIMVIPYIITDNPWWLLTSFIALPLGMLLLSKVEDMIYFIDPLNPLSDTKEKII